MTGTRADLVADAQSDVHEAVEQARRLVGGPVTTVGADVAYAQVLAMSALVSAVLALAAPPDPVEQTSRDVSHEYGNLTPMGDALRVIERHNANSALGQFEQNGWPVMQRTVTRGPWERAT